LFKAANRAKGATYDTQGKREARRLHQTARTAQHMIARGKREARRLHQTAPKARHMIARGKREARRLHQTAPKARHMIARGKREARRPWLSTKRVVEAWRAEITPQYYSLWKA